MPEAWLIVAGFALIGVLGVLGGWMSRPLVDSLAIRRRIDELSARLDVLTERFGGFQRREIARSARLALAQDNDVARQAAAVLLASNRGNSRGDSALSLKDRLRRRVATSARQEE